MPFVARGAGSGLSGGALPVADGVVISLQRLRRILDIDPVNRRATVEPGVTNLAVSHAAAPFGLYYAPDPSSQQVCTIGGNIAENSGGAHCLKYGFTTHHVHALEVVLADGTPDLARRSRHRSRRDTTCAGCSSAPRAPSASPRLRWSGCCAETGERADPARRLPVGASTPARW